MMNPIRYIIISLYFFLSASMNAQTNIQDRKLFPWRGSKGMFGYCTKEGKVIIMPQYISASPFVNDYAIVQKQEMYGVIDRNGKEILPFQYKMIELKGITNATTIAITRIPYNAWWKLGRWRFWPGFSMMGTSHDKRLFDTKVPMMQWELVHLEQEKIFAGKAVDPGTSQTPFSLYDFRINDHHMLINETLYTITPKGIKKTADDIFCVTDDYTLLQQKGKRFVKIDWNAKPVDSKTFEKTSRLSAVTGGREVTTGNFTFDFSATPTTYCFADEKGKQYVFPNFTHPFPGHIEPYPDAGFTADSILITAMQIIAAPATGHFLIYGHKAGKRHFFMLDKYGNWETDVHQLQGFTVEGVSGETEFPTAGQLDIGRPLPDGFSVTSFYKASGLIHCYLIKGTYENDDETLSRYGIYDNHQKKWKLQPRYASLHPLDEDEEFWAYQLEIHGLWGVINIQNKDIVIPPKYEAINPDGRVFQTLDKKRIYFYIDVRTGKEYRE